MTKPHGLLAEYERSQQLLAACRSLRETGYSRWDAHTPYPIHGLDEAMGLTRSNLGWAVLILALGGGLAGFLLQTWVSVAAYPLVIGGKPLFSWPAFLPITFETTVLGGALGAVVGFLWNSGLPRWHHPLFSSERFAAASNDRFFISVEAVDPAFDWTATRNLLEVEAVAVETIDD
jgi:hypothetical protein